MNEPTIYTISAGTMRPEDTIDAMVSAIKYYAPRVYRYAVELADAYDASLDARDCDDADEALHELWELFESMAGQNEPEYGLPIIYAGTCPNTPDEIIIVIGTRSDEADELWFDEWYG
jgi:hypothetical protein